MLYPNKSVLIIHKNNHLSLDAAFFWSIFKPYILSQTMVSYNESCYKKVLLYLLLVVKIQYCTLHFSNYSGMLEVHEMMDVAYQRIDEIKFYALNIRNRGTIHMNNAEHQHHLIGTVMQILPGGMFTAKNLRVDVDTLIIDVMAEMNADHNGYCDMGEYEYSINTIEWRLMILCRLTRGEVWQGMFWFHGIDKCVNLKAPSKICSR